MSTKTKTRDTKTGRFLPAHVIAGGQIWDPRDADLTPIGWELAQKLGVASKPTTKTTTETTTEKAEATS